MYLSRLILNLSSRAVRKDLADCQNLHRTIMRAFPQADGDDELGARARFGVLHRVDSEPHSGRQILIVQSQALPQWENLPADYLMERAACKSVGESYARIEDAMVLRFRCRANPTRKIDTKTGPDGRRRNGRRVELRDESAQLAWLQRKGEDGGFRLLDVSIVGGPVERGGLSREGLAVGDHPRSRLTFGTAIFEGRLQVVDADRLRSTLTGGIGSGKAYGFGLLSVAPGR